MSVSRVEVVAGGVVHTVVIEPGGGPTVYPRPDR